MLASGRFPQHHNTPGVRRGQLVAVWRKHDLGQVVSVARERADLCVRVHIPQLDAVLRPPEGGQPFAVRAERQRIPGSLITGEGVEQLAAGQIPKLGRRVGADGSEALAVGADDHREELLVAVRQDGDKLRRRLSLSPLPALASSSAWMSSRLRASAGVGRLASSTGSGIFRGGPGS